MRLTSLILAALLLAGCMGSYETDSPPGDAIDAPTVAIVEFVGPHQMKVRLTNNDDESLTVSEGGFRLLDANNTVKENDWQAAYWSGEPFPVVLDLGPGESVEGWLVFQTDGERGPYRLKYDYIAPPVVLPLPSQQ